MRIIWKITTIRAIAVLLCYLCDANLRGFAQHRRAHDSRPIAVTFAPQAASASTIASPSPWLPPVMTTRFPFRFCMLILLYRVCSVGHQPQHPFGAYIASREVQVCGGDERPEGRIPP